MNVGLNQYTLFIIIFLLLGLFTAIANSLTVRRFDQYPRSAVTPRVSILVPARNEAKNIELCVTSLLAQDYPDFEVIVLNDQSTDDTPNILSRLAQANCNLRVLEGSVLPGGWLGKHWACAQLAKAASGDLLLFTDADTRHAANMLRDSVSAMNFEGADLITAFPQEKIVTWGERLLVPVISFGIFTFLPIHLIQKFRWSAVSITIGQFMLFRRDAYEAIGGFESVRTNIVDDVGLGRKLIDAGFQWRLMDGTEHITCRMYHGFFEAVAGFGKSLFAVFDYRILPYVFAWLIVGSAFLQAPVVLVSWWLGHSLMSFPPGMATIAVILSFTLWLISYRRFKFPAYLASLYPLSLGLFILVAGWSLIHTLSGTATWKGRTLERVAMRWL